jgi:hypothetical protein
MAWLGRRWREHIQMVGQFVRGEDFDVEENTEGETRRGEPSMVMSPTRRTSPPNARTPSVIGAA